MLAPFNFKKWIDENRDQLRPPVCNKLVYEDSDFIIMVIGGPNTRKDYHDDPGEEFFYQLEGDMVLRVMENGAPRDIGIKEGEIFLLPAHLHHSPQRFENTVGLVMERKRRPGELDGFIWYCDKCHARLHDEYLPLSSIVKDLPPLFDRFWNDEQARSCETCGHVMPLPENRKKA
jgi:3-hydroxyanthranilate 3,4-dioxygenase